MKERTTRMCETHGKKGCDFPQCVFDDKLRDARERYADFIKSALDAGFTDEQVNFLWENCRHIL